MHIPTYGTLPRQLAKMPGLCLCVLGVYLVVLVHTPLFFKSMVETEKGYSSGGRPDQHFPNGPFSFTAHSGRVGGVSSCFCLALMVVVGRGCLWWLSAFRLIPPLAVHSLPFPHVASVVKIVCT